MKMKNVNNLFLKIAMVVGFVPNNNIEYKLAKKTFSYLYPGVISIGISLVQIHVLFTFKREMYNNYYPFIVFSTSAIFIRSVYVERETWTKWIVLYERTNNQLKSTVGENLELGSKFIWIFLAYIVVLILNRLPVHTQTTDISVYIVDITMFMILTAEYTATLFSMSLLRGFKILNKYSKKLYHKSELLSIIERKMTKKKAVYYKNLYQNLYDMTEYFNRLFGCLLMTSYIRFLTIIIFFFQYLINLVIKGELDVLLLTLFCLAFFYCLVSRSQLYLFI